VDFTWGTRGGAIRPWFVDGTVNMDGTYVDNLSDGRGAVFASNRYVQRFADASVWRLRCREVMSLSSWR
jgi:hypothetical protein